jgi:hypothetical protein
MIGNLAQLGARSGLFGRLAHGQNKKVPHSAALTVAKFLGIIQLRNS